MINIYLFTTLVSLSGHINDWSEAGEKRNKSLGVEKKIKNSIIDRSRTMLKKSRFHLLSSYKKNGKFNDLLCELISILI
jgi:hypothetical protein